MSSADPAACLPGHSQWSPPDLGQAWDEAGMANVPRTYLTGRQRHNSPLPRQTLLTDEGGPTEQALRMAAGRGRPGASVGLANFALNSNYRSEGERLYTVNHQPAANTKT